jgi:hypothetical protein
MQTRAEGWLFLRSVWIGCRWSRLGRVRPLANRAATPHRPGGCIACDHHSTASWRPVAVQVRTNRPHAHGSCCQQCLTRRPRQQVCLYGITIGVRSQGLNYRKPAAILADTPQFIHSALVTDSAAGARLQSAVSRGAGCRLLAYHNQQDTTSPPKLCITCGRMEILASRLANEGRSSHCA